MQDAKTPDLAGLDRDGWLAALDRLGDERGYFEPLGASHSAIFSDDGPVLLVTFETMERARARQSHLPLGFELAAPRGWSQLCLLAHDATWFRDRRVYGYFDRLVDDGFFEDFDRVIFYGAGMCGYAAAAYSVAAPGSVVIAVQPQATLDPRRAGWDRRFLRHRRLCFTDRYGFAPQMVEAADRVFVLYDPEIEADAIHAAFFTCGNTELIRCRHFGDDIAADLLRLELLPGLLDLAAQGRLDASAFHRALRARGSYLPYLRNLVGLLAVTRQWLRLGKATRLLGRRFGGRRFQKAQAEAQRHLAAEGRSLPPLRREPAAVES